MKQVIFYEVFYLHKRRLHNLTYLTIIKVLKIGMTEV